MPGWRTSKENPERPSVKMYVTKKSAYNEYRRNQTHKKDYPNETKLGKIRVSK